MRSAVALLVMLVGCELVFDLREPADAPPGPAPFLDGYLARKPIDIQLSTMATLTDLPFMVRFAEDVDLVGVDPDVLELTDADGVTRLDFEIESFDANRGDLIVWVKIPVFDRNRLYLYFSGPQLLDRDPKQTWSSGFVGVWHFSAGAAGFLDSTGLNPALMLGNTMIPDDVKALVGNGRDFDDEEDLTLTPDPALDFGDTSFSFSAWVNPRNTAFTDGTPIAVGSSSQGGYGMFLGTGEWNAKISSGTALGGAEVKAAFASTPLLDRWTHLVAVVDRELGELRTYVDGELAGATTIADLGGVSLGTGSLDLSRSASDEAYIGILDELRIYSTAISEAQISVDYNNLAPDGNVFEIGPSERAP